jgi:hypothetical protein
MITILRTSQMEQAARLLASRYPRLLIRSAPALATPIRFRQQLISDLAPFVVRSSEGDAQVAAWEKSGGVLLWMRSFRADEDLPEHDAQLLTECPLSMRDLDLETRPTRNVAVIYRPPTWRAHEREVEDRFPSPAVCKEFIAHLRRGSANPTLCGVLGIPSTGTIVCSDDAMMDAMRLTPRQFRLVRKATLRKPSYRKVIRLVPRIEPKDKALLDLYRAIKRCPEEGGAHLVQDNALDQGHRCWKVGLRRLERSGSVARKGTLAVYFSEGIKPAWGAIQARHGEARAALATIIATVDAAPDVAAYEQLAAQSVADGARRAERTPAQRRIEV